MSKVVAKYVGKGAYIDGIPARDMTSDEWDALSEEQRKKALDAGTHRLAKKSEVKDA